MISKVSAKILAKEYLSNGLNATKTIKKFKPKYNNGTAKVAGSRMLSSDNFRKGITEVMEEQGITDDYLLKEHNKVIKQDKHLPSKNTAIDMAYKLRGDYAPEKREIKSLNINYNDTEQVKKRLKDLEDELKEVRGRDSQGA